MNALAAILSPEPTPLPLIIIHGLDTEQRQIAARLADEGVPVLAIARGMKLSSTDVYDALADALEQGVILEMPKPDWPPGTSRQNRNALAGTILDNDDNLKFACARLFKATRLEAALLGMLLKRQEVTKSQLHTVIEQNRPSETADETDIKMVDVLICHLRKKLKPHNLSIETVWGIGYLMKREAREQAAALLQQVANG